MSQLSYALSADPGVSSGRPDGGRERRDAEHDKGPALACHPLRARM